MEVRDIGQGGQVSFGTGNNGSAENSGSIGSTIAENSNVDTKAVNKQSNGEKNIKPEDAKKAVDKLNKLMEDTPTHLEYEIHGKFNDVIVKVIDDKTKEVVKEIPSKKIVDMVDKLCELAGLFMDKKV
ncbi:flagellar protein FlaG [Clostridium sp. WILCCON 0269]|uniref:Flagellar protein FlaG n=1 Tax=Candidatus Clostridium eludens TaxID=3381663 RepID=A0ABW8SMA4_9CLOT